MKRKPITIKGEGYAIQRDDGNLSEDIGNLPHVLHSKKFQTARLRDFKEQGFFLNARVVKVKYTIKVVDDDAALSDK